MKNDAIEFNEYMIANHFKQSGIFVLISDICNSPEYMYNFYKMRCYIEDTFQIYKNILIEKKPRSWYAETFDGRLFAQFVGLCYYSYIYERIRCVKYLLNKSIIESKTRGDAYKLDKSLLSWVNNKSIHQILLWFDSIKTTIIKIGESEEIIESEMKKKIKNFWKYLNIQIL